VAKTLAELQDHDMLGLYHVDGRPFLHLMRLHNPRQWWTRIYPQSPFDDDKDNQQKQRVSEIRINDVSDCHKPGVRGEGLGVRGNTKSTTLSGKPDANAEFRKQAIDVLNYLNENTGRAYRPVDSNLGLIIARLKSGASALQCREVVFNKCTDWLTDPKMSEYLRPATLFNATKFEQYLGEQNHAMP
jgi:hypothetical protein